MTDNLNTNPQDSQLIEIAMSDDSEADLSAEETSLLAMIPLMSGSNKKINYLSYRATGFPITQAAQLAGVSVPTVHNWRKQDATFKSWEQDKLPYLQEKVGVEVIRLEFMRIMRLWFSKDFQILVKGMEDLESLSPREYEQYKNSRKYYTPGDLLALEKAINPEKHQQAGPTVIQLSWTTRSEPIIESEGKELIEGSYDELED